jgi:hypothetical protein
MCASKCLHELAACQKRYVDHDMQHSCCLLCLIYNHTYCEHPALIVCLHSGGTRTSGGSLTACSLDSVQSAHIRQLPDAGLKGMLVYHNLAPAELREKVRSAQRS